MQILLIRHAKVKINSTKKLNFYQMQEWLKRYELCDISYKKPSREVIEIIKSSKFIACSSSLRAKSSLELIDIKINFIDDIFKELKITLLPLPFIKLKPSMWLFISRVYTLVPFSMANRVFKKEKKRVKKAAEILNSLSKEHKSITLLGHGVFNYLLVTELKKFNFKVKKSKNAHQNWGYKLLKSL